ncbi:MAG: hypothetical protein ABI151_12865, partial [Chitinophagaceae bacterium]
MLCKNFSALVFILMMGNYSFAQNTNFITDSTMVAKPISSLLYRSFLELIKAYNNSNAVQEIVNSDYSGFIEPILTEADYKLIDSLVTVDNENLRTDSAQGNRRAEGSQGKRP